jgi:hypothetical protein
MHPDPHIADSVEVVRQMRAERESDLMRRATNARRD